MIQPYRFTCRQCPQNKWLNAGYKAPDFTCNINQNHLLCQCCLEAMPDRTVEIGNNPLLPKQSCKLCFKPYCDLYWGCRKFGCKKCLVKFVNYDPDMQSLDSLILDNLHESRIFSDWMVRKNKTIVQIFNECIQKLLIGTYKTEKVDQNTALECYLCRTCCLTLFKELAYQYRNDISNDELFGILNLTDHKA